MVQEVCPGKKRRLEWIPGGTGSDVSGVNLRGHEKDRAPCGHRCARSPGLASGCRVGSVHLLVLDILSDGLVLTLLSVARGVGAGGDALDVG